MQHNEIIELNCGVGEIVKIYYRPKSLGRYLGLIKHYEHLGGMKGYTYYSLGFWWGEIEFK